MLFVLLLSVLFSGCTEFSRADCGHAYKWVEPAVAQSSENFFASARNSDETNEQSFEKLKGIRWGEYPPGMEQVTLFVNANRGVGMDVSRVHPPNQPHKPKGMIKILSQAVNTHNKEFAQLLTAGKANLTFIINTEDQPAVGAFEKRKLTLFSMCRDPSSSDLPAPDFTFDNYAETGYEETNFWDIRDLLLMKSRMVPWKSRHRHVFMRHFGGVGYRKTLFPELLDHQHNRTDLAMLGARVNIRDSGFVASSKEAFEWLDNWCTYRYLVHTGGMSYSASLKYKLACASVVFVFEGEYKEFYYPALQPGIHYVSLREGDKKQLKEEIFPTMKKEIRKLETENHDHAPPMAGAGQDFIVHQLTPDALSCYWLKTLIAYSRVYYTTSKDQVPDQIDFKLQ